MSNYAQYICGGAHCKCMNLDGTCKNYHNGDHLCPTSQQQGNDMVAPDPKDDIGIANPPKATIEDKLKDLFSEFVDDRGNTNYIGLVNGIQALITTETTKATVDEFQIVLEKYLKLNDSAFQAWLYRHETTQLEADTKLTDMLVSDNE